LALPPGTRLGVYEVTTQIGEGGMGQVYRATDTKLKRQVAIKILPPSLAADPDRLARFQREAEVLASLNHPNIAHIYGLERQEGQEGTAGPATSFIVMELVEGFDLSERIGRGAIPIDEALPIAKQIADALEAAHEQGIIHRDLKPANIKVRADGTVKVLDFGLAKAMGPAEAGHHDDPRGVRLQADLTRSPTITTPAMTQAGMILGTAAYMSPEQARGLTVDKRADLWAFGVVLWEMLTGTRLFEGSTVSDTLASVLKTEPDWNALAPTTPAAIRRLLRRCLEKDRRRRIADAADARLEIEDALTAPAAVDGASVTSAASGGRLAWMAALSVVAVVIVALAVPAVRYLREAPPSPLPETRVDIVTPATDSPAAFALSPDGRQIVFVASGDGAPRLWVRSLATTTAQPLAGTEGAQFPFWSPDSRSVGFFAEGKLKRFDLGGGAPQTVAPAPNARGGTWNADGFILFNPSNASPLFRVPASGGQPVAVTKLDRQQSGHRFPSFLPDGRHFLFYAQGAPDTAGIYLGSLDAPGTHRLTLADTGGGVYLSPGWLLWIRAQTLVARRLNLNGPALTGDPVILADRVVVDTTFNVAALSASPDGPVAYRTGGATRRQLIWADRSGTALGPLGAPDETGMLDLTVSPDGHRVAVSRSVQGNWDIWLLDGPRMSRFTFDAESDRYPVWSPDGRRIVFASARKGHRDLYQGSSSRAGEGLLLASAQDKVPSDWSADGRFVLYMSRDPQTDWDLWVLPMEGDRTSWVFLKTPFRESAGTFSPDGRWVAYMSDESGRMEIYVRPFAAPADGAALQPRSGQAATAVQRSVRLQPDPAGGQWQVSTAGGIHPRWGRDGKELYYLNPAGAMMAAPIAVTGSTLAPGTPVALFPTRIVGGGAENSPGPQYDVTRDGRFLINTLLDEASAPITLLQNWHPEANTKR